MTNEKAIVKEMINNKFRCVIEFKLFDKQQKIPKVVYDTGCMNSLISADSLEIDGDTKFQLKILCDKDTKLAIAKGVEAHNINMNDIKNSISIINDIKNKYNNSKEIFNHIKMELSKEDIKRILKSKNVRYHIKVEDFKIDDIPIEDVYLSIAFNIGQLNLVGMSIISKLTSLIFNSKGKTYLIFDKQSEDANSIDNYTEDINATVIEAYKMYTKINQNI